MKNRVKRVFKNFFPEDLIVAFFLLLMILLMFLLGRRPEITRIVARHYIYILTFIIAISALSGRLDHKLFKTIRNWLPLIIAYIVFENLGDMVHNINPRDRDALLMKIDYWMFGVHPGVWMQQFIRPWLSDLMHSFYTSYYLFAPLAAGILYIKGEYYEFRNMVVAGILGAYIGFLGYVLVPAVGPRYYMAHLFTVDLHGTLTHYIQNTLDSLEPFKRDCFPSLHTALTAIPTLFLWKYERKISYFFIPVALGLFVSTVYGRYHYVIDVIAGLALAGLCFYLAPKINDWWYRHVTGPNLDRYFPVPVPLDEEEFVRRHRDDQRPLMRYYTALISRFQRLIRKI